MRLLEHVSTHDPNRRTGRDTPRSSTHRTRKPHLQYTRSSQETDVLQCGGRLEGDTLVIDRAEATCPWPFEVERMEIRCNAFGPRSGEVYFSSERGVFALNGNAKATFDDPRPLWLDAPNGGKINVSLTRAGCAQSCPRPSSPPPILTPGWVVCSRHTEGGSILDADPPPQGVKIARLFTPKGESRLPHLPMQPEI